MSADEVKKEVEQQEQASDSQEAPESVEKAPESVEKAPESIQKTPEAQEPSEDTTEPPEGEKEASEPSGDDDEASGPKSEEVQDAEKRTGIKEAVVNNDAIAIEKDKADAEGNSGDGEGQPPSFFVDKEAKQRVEVDIMSNREDGKILSVARTGLGIDYGEFKYLHKTREWFEFTVPSYEDMSTYRQRCGIYRQEAQQVLIDKLQLRNFLLVWHLKDWSLVGKDGKKVELAYDEDGSLDEESMQKVYSAHPTILDVVLTIFEKDILLT